MNNIIRPRQGIPQAPPSSEDCGNVEAKNECQWDVLIEVPTIKHHLVESPVRITLPDPSALGKQEPKPIYKIKRNPFLVKHAS